MNHADLAQLEAGGRYVGAHAEKEIDAFVAQLLGQRTRIERLQAKTQAWVTPQSAGDGLGEIGFDEAGLGPDGQATDGRALDEADFAVRFVHQAQRLRGGIDHHAAIDSRMRAAAVALEQRRAIGGLKARDDIAQGRLRNAQGIGSTAHIAGVSEFGQHFEFFAVIHGEAPCRAKPELDLV